MVERQFGTVMLDMMFAGREIKTYIPLMEVSKILGEHLSISVNEIESLLNQEITKIEDQLLAFHNQIRPALEITEASTEDKMYQVDEDAFLYFDDNTIVLTAEQELTLKAIAYSIKQFLNREGEGVLKDFFSVSLEKLKQILAAFVNEKYNMILTEQAWQWIDKTEETLSVKVLLAKLIIDDAYDLKHEKSHTDIRKAMFENKMLLEKIVEYMEDETVWGEFERYIGTE